MTDNQNKELRTAYYKMITFCTLFYGALTFIIITDTKEKHVFMFAVALGYFVSVGFLITNIIKTYLNK